MLNLMPNRINSFGKLKCTQRPHATPFPPHHHDAPSAAAFCLACTHNFSSAPRLSLPTSFVNCTHLTRTHPLPIPSIPASLYLPPLLICCGHYICTISNTVQQFARLFSVFFCIRPQKITSQIVDNPSPSPPPLSLLPRPSLLAQRVCNFCKK